MSEVDPASAGANRMLQRACNGLIEDDAVLANLMGGEARIFQDVPPKAKLPYIALGEGQDLDDTIQCLVGEENYIEFHVWSEASGWAECKDIASRLKKLLHESDPPLEGG